MKKGVLAILICVVSVFSFPSYAESNSYTSFLRDSNENSRSSVSDRLEVAACWTFWGDC